MTMIVATPRDTVNCRKRDEPIAYEDRGPDSYECTPGVDWHTQCWIDYSDLHPSTSTSVSEVSMTDTATPALYVPNFNLPDTVLVDIDGTIAKMVDRGPHDLHRVHEDEPAEAIIELVNLLRRRYSVVFLSGREDTCRDATEAWLEQHAGYDESEPVFMRPAGDYRRDSIVKAELFDAHVRDRYNVRLVLDDRNQVVKMWRAMGLTCLQVADGDF